VIDSTLRELLFGEFLRPEFQRAIAAGTPRTAAKLDIRRVEFRCIDLQGQRSWQRVQFSATQTFTANIAVEGLSAAIDEVTASGWSNYHFEHADGHVEVRLSKKGKFFVQRKRIDSPSPAVVTASHNRIKDLPFAEGQPNTLLQTLGLITSGGQIKPTQRGKFTQINEFIKHLRHAMQHVGELPTNRPLQILDAGCGSSYLTFAVHHDLVHHRNIPAEILGVDVNPHVIRKSIEKRTQLELETLRFEVAKLRDTPPVADIVLALHACDTATDDALSLAIRAQAQVILSVPCCHHHLNEQLKSTDSAAVLQPMLRYGLLKQRFADQLTDAFRAQLLRMSGYHVDLVEFVGTEHTPRNLMIRAVKRDTKRDVALLQRQYAELKSHFGVTPYLERWIDPEVIALPPSP